MLVKTKKKRTIEGEKIQCYIIYIYIYEKKVKRCMRFWMVYQLKQVKWIDLLIDIDIDRLVFSEALFDGTLRRTSRCCACSHT